VLGWKPPKLATGSPGQPALPDVARSWCCPEYGETLKPDLRRARAPEDDAEWMILVQELARRRPTRRDPPAEEAKKWQASPQTRFERLLRETGVPIGLL
jgi:hypothetical protein